jgi:hypothetical protein
MVNGKRDVQSGERADEFKPWVLRREGSIAFLEYAEWQGVRCIFTTRVGGTGISPYDSLNLSFNRNDSPDAVGQNLALLRRFACLNDERIVRTQQVHSAIVNHVGSEREDYVGDGLITALERVWLSVSVADCIPIYMYDMKTPAVGMVHAGWKGTLANIVRSCLERMSSAFGTKPSDVTALIGPGIGPCCYKVSPELAAEFERTFAGSTVGRHVNLFEANRVALETLGVSCLPFKPICTSCNQDLFFSHRRDHGHIGRMLAMIQIA